MRALLVLVVLARTAHADCAEDEARLRREALAEAHRARTWNTAWLVGFGTASLAQLGYAASGIGDDDARDVAYVGAAKAGLGALGRLVTPLRVRVPEATGDACRDRDALAGSLRAARKRERNMFYVNHAGALLVNAAGAVVLAQHHSLGLALSSAAIGYPVGLLAVYTMPRHAWHLSLAPNGVAIARTW